MPPNPHPSPDPAAAPHGFREWSRHVGDMPSNAEQGRPPQPLWSESDLAHPMLKVFVAAFIGYTLGRLIHHHA